MSLEFDRQALVSIFTAEASDNLEKLSSAVAGTTSDTDTPPTSEALHQLFIVAHSLKGAAALYGFETSSALAGILEKAFEEAREHPAHEWSALVPLTREILGRLRQQVQLIQRTGAEEPSSLDDLRSLYPPIARFMPAGDGPSESYLLPMLDSEVFTYFSPEAQEYLETITASLLELEKDPEEVGEIQRLFRAVHTLKGSAYTVGFQAIGDLTHELEDIVDAVLEGQTRLSPELTDRVFQALDVIRLLLLRDPSRLPECREDFQAVLQQLHQARKGWSDVAATSTPEQSPATPMPISAQPKKPLKRVTRRRVAAPERGDEVIRLRRNRLERLLNLVDELVIGRSRLEQRLLFLEQLSRQVVTYEGKMLGSVRAFEEKHAFSPPEPLIGNLEMATSSFLSDFGALEFDKYDDFNILARSMAEVSADIAESMAQLSAMIRSSRDDMNRLQQLTLSLRDEIAQARMVPLSALFTRFQKAVREMGRTAGKTVSLEISGGEIELDTDVVQRLLDPVIHIVRNAVYHGIEPAAEREAAGKSAAGTVSLHAVHRGASVLIEIKDDGAGLNIAKIKAKAIALEVLSEAQAQSLSDTEAIEIIYLPGFSTASEIGDQAGRGVGMDVVKEAIEALNGHIDIETQAGVGTTFILRLPLTMLISTALIVRIGQQRFGIPLPAIREVLGSAAQAVRHIDGRSLLQIGEETIEIRSLAQLIGDRMDGPRHTSPVVVMQADQKVLGVTVDELLGRQEIVIKSLGPFAFFKRSGYNGVAIDPEGRVMLVLDAERLLSERRARKLPTAVQPAHTSTPKESGPVVAVGEGNGMRILLIDDSLSVRKFIGRMLETAGYQVDTAVDGEEGLRKATLVPYRLVITDLEMPKVNGFEVIQSLRELPSTKSLPIMVMTTRAADKHRQIAINLGANAYIPKPIEEQALIAAVSQCLETATAGV
jgi:chemosensory pili system protein ChpA (sensor histidine kinase/response regulator)